MGEAVEEVTIVQWLKAEGDPIDEYEPLLEVETDKVIAEIPSPASGTVLRILMPTVGEAVSVGTLLAWIGEPGEVIPEDSAPAEEKTPAVPVETTAKSGATAAPPLIQRQTELEAIKPGRHPELGFISPLVAKLAAQHQVDLATVNGTGLGGRITKNDLMSYVESNGHRIDTPKPPTPMAGEVIPHTLTRRRIAEHMVMSKRTSPHVTTVMEADLSAIIAHRKKYKDDFEKEGLRLTFTAYFVSATVAALKAFPLVNSSWSDESIILHPQLNVGMATDLGDEGLIVPVIKNADQLSLRGIARAVNDLAERARAKKLTADEVQDGTFTITNHGVGGSLFAAPIINQPQCAILGVGAIQKRVVVITDTAGNDSMAIRPMAYLSLTFDHRILDGAIADHFLAKLIEALEAWPGA
jgi:2-oxoglutarate dehydrogenase E2 component (dihydrolipoamide succinyltransferase)